MLYWILFLIITIVFAQLSIKFENSEKYFFKFLLFTSVIYFSAFRDGLGEDYHNYEDLLQYGELLDYSFKEPGYSFMANIVYYTNFSSVLFFLIFAIITNFLFIKGFFRYDNTFLAIFIYLTGTIFYFNTFNIVRQMCSASIFMFAIKYIENNNLKKYVLAILSASLFHVSAIILIPFYYILKPIYNKNVLLALLIGSILLGQVFRVDMTSILSQFIPIYEIYFDDENIVNSESGYLTLFINLVLLGILLFDKSNKSIKDNIAFNLFFIGVLFYNLIPSFFFIYRFAVYFIVFCPIVLPTLNKVLPKKIWSLTLILGFGVMFFLFLVQNEKNLKINPTRILPLESLFDKN